MALDIDYITTVLDRFEGNLRRGYVPQSGGKVLGKSGVTVGRGVDLGQHSYTSLGAMGVPLGLLDKLSPYLETRQEDAIAVISEHPLELSREEATVLNAAILHSFLQSLGQSFDSRVKASGSGLPPFSDRPRQVQAVTASLAYQYGIRGFPRTFGLLADGEYRRVAVSLDDPAQWGGKYTRRRKAEAVILREVVK